MGDRNLQTIEFAFAVAVAFAFGLIDICIIVVMRKSRADIVRDCFLIYSTFKNVRQSTFKMSKSAQFVLLIKSKLFAIN